MKDEIKMIIIQNKKKIFNNYNWGKCIKFQEAENNQG